MSPLCTIDALDDQLIRSRMRVAAAAGGWRIGPNRSAGTGQPPPCYPRPVRHAGGYAMLRRKPRRAHAARTLVELDTLLALGIVPATVGSTARGAPSWQPLASEGDITVLTGGADTARLTDAQVDLIVLTTRLAMHDPGEFDSYQRLRLPMLVIPDDDICAQLRIVGQAFELEARAHNLACGVLAQLDGFRAIRSVDSIAAYSVSGDGWLRVPTADSALGRLLQTLGLPSPRQPSSAVAVRNSDSTRLHQQHLGELDADLVLQLDYAGSPISPLWLDLAAGAPITGAWRQLNTAASYALTVPTVLTLPLALDALQQSMSG